MKKFKAESKRVLDLVINSIYTNKEIFLRELLSNASDAIDKLYNKSLNENLGFSKEDFFIRIDLDKSNRTIKVTDNGLGMTENELENNLGIIAKSDSFDFKQKNPKNEDINIIGQFGVGFYSAFMVSKKVEVLSKAYGESEANLWISEGTAGYDVKKAEKADNGTEITLYLKENTEEDNYDEFLEEYKVRELVKKYSDYIRYAIRLEVEKTRENKDNKEEAEIYKELETLNSMIPLWKKNKNDIKDEEYNNFYKDLFFDYTDPIKVVHAAVEGVSVNYSTLFFIPGKAPFNYYTKQFEKGLKLYSNGILIMDKCEELLPDYFSFIKGVVDSELTLNISRETIQHNYQLKRIASNLEKKISSTLSAMLESDRENYEKFFKEFGLQLKYGVYDNWGINKDKLQDLLIFFSIKEDKYITLNEYVEKMKEDQKYIYYATGNSVDAIKLLPQAERILEYDYDVLCLTDNIDEFAIKIMRSYKEKDFKSVASGQTGLEDKTEHEQTDIDKELITIIKDALGDKVSKVKISEYQEKHPVILTTEGELSIEMEKMMKSMPYADNISAQKILDINSKHPIYQKLKSLFEADKKDEIKDYAKILLTQAQLIEGLPVENPAEYADLICRKLSN